MGHKKKDCWSKPGGGKSKGKGKDAKSLEPQQLEQVPNKEANSIEICAVGS